MKKQEVNGMKKYFTPEIEIVEFDAEDIITTSGPPELTPE